MSGKGEIAAEYNLKIRLRTLGGLGIVTASVKKKEGHGTVEEFEIPISTGSILLPIDDPDELTARGIVSRHDAETFFKKVVRNVEVCSGAVKR